jgi:type III secretion protein J
MKKAVYLLSGTLLAVLSLCGCSRQLESGLREQDAHQVVVVLRENGIAAETVREVGQKKDASSWQVNVRGQSETVIKAWKILRENGLPREKVKGLDDVFANSGIIPTAAEERARLLSGLSGEVTRTLDSLPGVVDARVQLVLPDNNPLLDRNQQAQPTAAVLLQYRGEQPPLKEIEVKTLVARAVEGLSPDGVAVVMKKIENRVIPAQYFGPLPVDDWFSAIALSLSGVAGVGSLGLLFLGKRRKLKIAQLEKELAEALQRTKTPRAIA